MTAQGSPRETPIHRFVAFVESRSVPVLIALALLTAVFGYFASRVVIDPEVLRLLPEDSKVLERIEEHGSATKDVDHLIIGLTAEDPFTLAGLGAVEQAVELIEAMDPILGSITPLNLFTARAKGRSPVFGPLSAGGRAPVDAAELEQYRARVLSDPLAVNRVVSAQGHSLSLIFPIQVLDDYRPFLEDLESILPILREHYEVRLAGWIPLNETTRRFIMRDPPILIAIAVAVSFIIFIASFGAVRAFVLPLIAITASLLWTIGLMGMLEAPLTVVGVMIPPLIFALGSSYGIHILNQYYRQVRSTEGAPVSLSRAIAGIVRTVILASATTAIGFGSLVFATVPRIREFGLFTCLGVLFCALISLLFYPAALSRLRPPAPRHRDRVRLGLLTRFTRRIGEVVGRFRYLIVLLVLATAVAFGFAIRQVRFETDFTSYYRGDVPALEDNRMLMKEFGSFMDINLTVTAPEDSPRHFLDLETLRRLDSLEQVLRGNPNVSDVVSFVSYLKAVNLAVNGSYELPEQRGAVLFLARAVNSLSGPARDYVDTFVGEGMKSLTLRVYVYDGQTKGFVFEEDLQHLVDFLGEAAEVHLTERESPEIWGWNLVALELSRILARDQVVSALVSAGLVFTVTSLAFGSVWFGLLSLAPLAVGVMLNFVFMWAAGIHLDVLTAMFSSVAIGVGVDDSIHLLIQYRRFTGPDAVPRALEQAGRPILLTSMGIIAGLGALAFSSFLPVARFGLLISTALLSTTFGALVILPALLSFRRNRGRGGAVSCPHAESL